MILATLIIGYLAIAVAAFRYFLRSWDTYWTREYPNANHLQGPDIFFFAFFAILWPFEFPVLWCVMGPGGRGHGSSGITERIAAWARR